MFDHAPWHQRLQNRLYNTRVGKTMLETYYSEELWQPLKTVAATAMVVNHLRGKSLSRKELILTGMTAAAVYYSNIVHSAKVHIVTTQIEQAMESFTASSIEEPIAPASGYV